MEPPAPFFSIGEHFGVDLPGARALFTTRRGGRSRGPYASLNLGLLSGDDLADVRANHETVASLIGRPLARCRQVHGTAVWDVDHGADHPAYDLEHAAHGPEHAAQEAEHPADHTAHDPGHPPIPEADGLISTRADRAPVVLVADCLPVVVAAPGVVAVLHAGWRGLAGGILAKGVARVRAVRPDAPLTAAVGPGAGGCCYEVGPEVHAVFAADYPEARHGGNLDLKAIASAQLGQAGVAEVHDLGLCTLCGDPGLFFSHRRDHGVTGRQAGIGWLR